MEKKDYILIVTANENETEALLSDIDFICTKNQRSDIPYDVSFYNIGTYGYYNVVHFELITEGSVGSDASQASIMTAIDAFHPKAVILVGIAFGKEFSDNINKKQKIGDVLISKSVADYESGKIKDAEIQSDGFISESGRELFSVFKNFSRSWQHRINNGPAKCEFGLILSGDKVLDDRNFKEKLMNRYPRAIGGEMEGRGAYTACRNRGISEWIIVKAICDWADGTKSNNKDENQVIASMSAVSLLNHIFTDSNSLSNLSTPVDVKNSMHSKNGVQKKSEKLEYFKKISESEQHIFNLEYRKAIDILNDIIVSIKNQQNNNDNECNDILNECYRLKCDAYKALGGDANLLFAILCNKAQ